MRKKEWKEGEDIREEDIGEEAHFEIDAGAFEGPFTCHKRKAKRIQKKISYAGLQYQYDVWQCPICKKELLDMEQADRLDSFWTFQKLLEDKLISIERNINYDGKAFFIRFPKTITQKWKRQEKAEIKVLSPRKMLIEVKG